MSLKDPVARAAYNRAWRKANVGKVRTSQRAKSLRREFGGSLTTEELRAIMEHPCAYCGGPSEQVEHCTPMSRGGTNDAHNVVAACADCNYEKQRRTVLEYLCLWPTETPF
jgi:5-methylcytosine-specific restriction endonuclease McrA